MDDRKRFYNALFEPAEGVCWSKDTYGTSVKEVEYYGAGGQNFFCINPLRLNKDMQPRESWHSIKVGRRADCNVVSYRNILCEFDHGSIEEQFKVIEGSEVPYTTLVHSGGKSLHMIISLNPPCETKEEYSRLVKRIYAKLPGIDTSTSNPSRFSRAPEALRNGVTQTLLVLRPRVFRTQLDEWLGPDTSPAIRETAFNNPRKGTRILRRNTEAFLYFGAPEGFWNASLFKAVCDMSEAGYSEQEILDKCEAVTGSLDTADLKTISSAIARVRREENEEL